MKTKSIMKNHILNLLFVVGLIIPINLFSQDFFKEELIMPSESEINEKFLHKVDDYFTIKYKITPLKLNKGDGKGVIIRSKENNLGYYFFINDVHPIQVYNHQTKKVICSKEEEIKTNKYYEFELKMERNLITVKQKIKDKFVVIMTCNAELNPPFDVFTTTQRTGAIFKNIEITPNKPIQSNDINSDLIAHYPFDGDILDKSGNNLNGRVIGNLNWGTDRFGNDKSAFKFDGTTYVDVENNDLLNLQNLTFGVVQ